MAEKPLFVKYPEIPYVEGKWHFKNPIEVLEKLDGSNCQVRCYDYRIWPGCRSKSLDNRVFDSPDNLSPVAKWMAHFKKWAMKNESIYNLPNDVVVFGEWMGGGAVRYPDEVNNKFFLIDVAMLNKSGEIGEFLEYETAVNFCREFELKDINFSDILVFGRFSRDDLDSVLQRTSRQRLAIGELEGVVTG